MPCIIKHCNTCKAVNCPTRLNNCPETMQIVTSHSDICTCIQCNNNFENNIYGIAIDIGTTTLAFELIQLSNGETCATHTILNSQRLFGADIVSRIEASNNGNSQILKNLIQKDILDGMKTLCKKAIIPLNRIKNTVISANTTMIHLLLGYDCSGLGIYPFKPITTNKLNCKFKEIFKTELFNCELTILPSISAYIGADIVSGIFMTELAENEEIILLIDIGTNGEICLGNKNKILCTSTAAGPALEGGNISCGTGAVEGAISSVTYNKINQKFICQTINNKTAIGICGSGIIDTTAELLNNSFIDNTGLLKDEFFEKGIEITDNIFFTQNDIRQIQLAKSAIRAGIEILIDEYGTTEKNISKIYISGGFGYYIDIKNACNIGIFPNHFMEKATAIGNSSLGGAKKYLLDTNADTKLLNITNISKELYLAENPYFNELYIKELNFNLKKL